MSNFLTNYAFLIYASIAITFLFFGVLIGYQVGRQDRYY
jgi:hypothetical protein